MKNTEAGDLETVVLDRTTDLLTVTYTLAKPLPTSGMTGVLLNLSSPDGMTTMQTGAKWIDGQQIANFVADSAAATQTNFESEVLIKGNTVVASYPVAALTSLGNVWQWQAITSIAGEDVDTAPEPGDDVVNPTRATLALS